MPEVPMSLMGLFIFITIGLWFGFRITLFRGFAISGQGKRSNVFILSLALGLWLLGTAMMAEKGTFQNFDQFPPPIMVVVFMSMILTFVLAFSRIGLMVIEGAGITWLVGFQGFRVLVEVFLHQMYLEGIVPEQMTYVGYNFDILAGVSALVMAWQISQKNVGQKAILVWNILGLLLLLNIIIIAILSMPTQLRMFDNEPANTFVTYMPFIWLPAFHVQAALFGHLLVFRALKRGVSVS
jgi:hypothetical protein